MNLNAAPLAIDESSIEFAQRPLSGDSEVQMGWSVTADHNGALLSGFAKWHGEHSPFKLINYDEIMLVLEGTFGFATQDGERYEGGPGTTLRINKNTRVRYFGQNAKVFFVITPPCE